MSLMESSECVTGLFKWEKVVWQRHKSPAKIKHWNKKWSHFDLKSWVTGGTKLQSNWRIFESNWLSISSQFDSQYRVNLTLNIESIWLSISSQFDSQYRVNLTLDIESIWLSISSEFDSRYRVNLTLNIESIKLIYSPIIFFLFFFFFLIFFFFFEGLYF